MNVILSMLCFNNYLITFYVFFMEVIKCELYEIHRIYDKISPL